MQLVPIKEPRIDGYTVLAVDPELKDMDTAKFVFTDISHYTTNQVYLTTERLWQYANACHPLACKLFPYSDSASCKLFSRDKI